MSTEAKASLTESGAFSNATGRSVEEGGADKPRYRRYQYDLIIPHCGRSVPEVGAGLGEFAAQFTGLDRLVVTDVDPDAVTWLKAGFPALRSASSTWPPTRAWTSQWTRRSPSMCWSTSRTTPGC